MVVWNSLSENIKMKKRRHLFYQFNFAHSFTRSVARNIAWNRQTHTHILPPPLFVVFVSFLQCYLIPSTHTLHTVRISKRFQCGMKAFFVFHSHETTLSCHTNVHTYKWNGVHSQSHPYLLYIQTRVCFRFSLKSFTFAHFFFFLSLSRINSMWWLQLDSSYEATESFYVSPRSVTKSKTNEKKETIIQQNQL